MNFNVQRMHPPKGITMRRTVENASGDVTPLEIEASAEGVAICRRWPTVRTRDDLNAVISQLEQAWSDHLALRDVAIARAELAKGKGK